MDFRSRLTRLRAALESAELPALLVSHEINVRYLTGFTGDSTYLLVTADRACLLSDRRYEQQIAEQCPDFEAFIRGPERWMHELVAETASDMNLPQLGIEGESLTVATFGTLARQMPNVELSPTSGLVAQLRMIKDTDELAILRRAVQCAERTFGVVRASLRPEMTEQEIAYLIESTIRSFGGEGVGFSSIVAVGENGALPHYHPVAQPIGRSGNLLIDWGAKLDGYTSDLTRTMPLGSASPKFAEVYQVVLDAQLAAIEAIRPGIPFSAVDAAARDWIARAGFGDYFGHGLGHGIGLEIHEAPRLASIAEGELVPGMVITIEPGIYLPGEFGVRIEDDVLVTDGGHEVLSSLGKGLEESVVIL